MKLALRYLVRGGHEPKSIALDPRDYFEALEADETWEADGVPRFNHAREYLPPDLDLAWTELEAPLASEVSLVREVFSPNGVVSYWHRADRAGTEEICITSRISSSAVHILRLHRFPAQPWQLMFSTVITDLPGGSQSEELLYAEPLGAPGHAT